MVVTSSDARNSTTAAEHRVEASCAFCELPLPVWSGEIDDARERRDAPVYCCYGCRLAADITHKTGEAGLASLALTRLGVAVFLSMNVMMFAMALYANDVYATAPDAASQPAQALTGVLRYLSLFFATPVLVLLGWPLVRGAVDDARSGVASLDAFVVLGVCAAFVYSYWSTLADTGAIYYETACAVLVFVTLGRWFEASSKLEASDTMRSLERLLPRVVVVERDGRTEDVALESLRLGDCLIVAAGQRCAADGVVLSGRASVDEHVITGESAAVVKEPGDVVSAGSLSLDGTLVVRVEAVGDEGAIGRLMGWLEDARRAKGGFERLVDRMARFFVPATMALAVIGFALGLERGGLEEGLMTALSVTLIACPCTLGIATPLAVWVGLARAARGGVLFRSSEALEALAEVNAVCFDKTGTLTTGEPILSAVAISESPVTSDSLAELPLDFAGVRVDERPAVDADSAVPLAAAEAQLTQVLEVAGGLVRGATHPLARGLAQRARVNRVVPAQVDHVSTVAGRGLEGRWQGHLVSLGSTAFMRERGLVLDTRLGDAVDTASSKQLPVACLGWDGLVRGVFTFEETVRPEAARAITNLESLGCGVAMLSGDRAASAESLAARLGLQSAAELTPGDKLRTLEVMRAEHGAVAMVGDGINDVPALARADVGIALGCGTDLARDAAAVCLLSNDLTRVPWALALARRTVRTVKQNLFWACAYNAIGVPLAMLGHLNPAWAAVAMVVSSVVVVTNSLALARLPLEAD